MAGKFWQPNLMNAEGRKTGTHHSDKKVEREGGRREWKQPLSRASMLNGLHAPCSMY